MGILIKKAVLHILDASVGMPVLSENTLELEDDIYSFLEKTITKLFNDDNAKQARFFDPPGRVAEISREITRDLDFLEASQELARIFFEVMQNHPAIVPADLVCVLFSNDDLPYLGIFKLNYRTGFIHTVRHDEDNSVNSLVKQKTVLPSETQKLEEAAAINLIDLSILLVEKEYEIDGVKDQYLSSKILYCDNRQLSNNEKARVIEKVTRKMSEKYCDGAYEPVVRLKQAVSAQLGEADYISLDEVAREVFRDDPPAQRECLEEFQKAGFSDSQVRLPEKLVSRKFTSQKIETDTGVEINFPSDYYNDKNKLEFITNSDGTISIVIKNVNKIISK